MPNESHGCLFFFHGFRLVPPPTRSYFICCSCERLELHREICTIATWMAHISATILISSAPYFSAARPPAPLTAACEWSTACSRFFFRPHSPRCRRRPTAAVLGSLFPPLPGTPPTGGIPNWPAVEAANRPRAGWRAPPPLRAAGPGRRSRTVAAPPPLPKGCVGHPAPPSSAWKSRGWGAAGPGPLQGARGAPIWAKKVKHCAAHAGRRRVS